MSLVRYNPWSLFDQLNRELNNPLATMREDDDANVATANWAPSVDITENEQAFVLHADIPGVEPEKIELTMEDGMLTIKGEKRHEVTENKEGYKRVERSYGSFYRRFSLPDNTDPELIKASGKDGVLEVIIPKVEAKRSKKIDIQPKRSS